MRSLIAGLAAIVLLSGCTAQADDGVPDTSTDAIASLVNAVEEAHPGNPWWGHVRTTVREGFLADVTFRTDYQAGDPELREFCRAVLDAVKIDGHFLVNFYGYRTVTEQQIDGSDKTEVTLGILMDGTPKSGCTKSWHGENIRIGE